MMKSLHQNEELIGPTVDTDGGSGVISSIIHLTMCNPI